MAAVFTAARTLWRILANSIWNSRGRQLTVAVNVDCTGVALSVVVSVSLVGVCLVNAVVAAIANIVPVGIVLGRVIKFGAVVLK